MLLVVDNGSIYTRQLTGFLDEKQIPFETESPHLLNLDSLPKYDAFILSGRRKNDKKINVVNSKIILYCVNNDCKKLLGICYGAEILALALGGTIKRIPSLKKGIESIQVIAANPLCSSNSMDVFESHGYEISKLPDILVSLAKSDGCNNEIIQHVKKPIFGTQFHPEMSPDGHVLIEKFCNL